MHIHQSIVDKETGKNIFVNDDGSDNALLGHFIGGLQRYMPATLALAAPNINSYRRFTYHESPINTHWGYDNRTCGLRVPSSLPEARRVENRLAGSDVNPYLAMAGTLAAGYLGIKEQIKPKKPHKKSVHDQPRNLPQHLDIALVSLKKCNPIREILSGRFVDAFVAVKNKEHETYRKVISSWEREHLLLNV